MHFGSVIRRLAHIFAVVVRHCLAHAAWRARVRWAGLRRRPAPAGLSGPERFRTAVEDLGGSFIKFGQLLALQPDILSLRYCDALYKLLDRVEPFGYEQVERVFVEEFGRTPAELFDSFESRPVATASIGQVHAAALGGRKLAVKVRRPGVEREFAADIRLMAAAARAVRRLRVRGLYWMIEPVDEFVAWTREELDYRCEARYMESLRRNARDNPREAVPAVLWSHTTSRVLVTDFVEGVTVVEYLRALEAGDEILLRRLGAGGFDADAFAQNIVDNFLNDVFRHGLFHADLHPANLVIMPGNVVGYIDFGITGVLSPYYRQVLIAFTLAYTRADLDGMCEQFFKVSVVGEDSDREGFREGLDRLAGEWYRVEGRERRYLKSITMVMLDMLKLSRQARVWPDRDVIKYIRSAIAIDGLRTRFAPGFDVGRYLEVVCARYLRWQVRGSLFSPDRVLDWVSANSHLLRDGVVRAHSLLARQARGEAAARAEVRREDWDDDGGPRARAVQLAGVIFVVSLLIAAAGGEARLGVNLFTAEAVLTLAAATTLWRTIRGLA